METFAASCPHQDILHSMLLQTQRPFSSGALWVASLFQVILKWVIFSKLESFPTVCGF